MRRYLITNMHKYISFYIEAPTHAMAKLIFQRMVTRSKWDPKVSFITWVNNKKHESSWEPEEEDEKDIP
jgi:hypothetical protein